MREAATNAVIRGDIDETPHAVTSNKAARTGARLVLPIALIIAVPLIIWALLHFVLGSASTFKAGKTAFEQQNMGVAEQNFRLYLRDHPGDVNAALYLGRVLRVEHKATDAVEVLNVARKNAPKDTDVLREFGGALLDANQPKLAIAVFRTARDIDPKNSASWIGLVRALRAAGDPSAEDELQRAPADAQDKLRSQP